MSSLETLTKERDLGMREYLLLGELLGNTDSNTKVEVYVELGITLKGEVMDVYDSGIMWDYRVCNIKIANETLKVFVCEPDQEPYYFEEKKDEI